MYPIGVDGWSPTQFARWQSEFAKVHTTAAVTALVLVLTSEVKRWTEAVASDRRIIAAGPWAFNHRLIRQFNDRDIL